MAKNIIIQFSGFFYHWLSLRTQHCQWKSVICWGVSVTDYYQDSWIKTKTASINKALVTRALNTLEIIQSSWKCDKIERFQIYQRISILSFLFSSWQLAIFLKRQLINCRCCMSYDTHATDWIQFTFIMRESRAVDSYSFWQYEKLLSFYDH